MKHHEEKLLMVSSPNFLKQLPQKTWWMYDEAWDLHIFGTFRGVSIISGMGFIWILR